MCTTEVHNMFVSKSRIRKIPPTPLFLALLNALLSVLGTKAIIYALCVKLTDPFEIFVLEIWQLHCWNHYGSFKKTDINDF